MSKLEKALLVAKLSMIIVDMQEKKERIKQLNQYDHTATDAECYSPFFIEAGGGSTHIKYFPNNNEIGDSITAFFVELFDKLEADAEQELSKLLA